jgi:hypothetical protein
MVVLIGPGMVALSVMLQRYLGLGKSVLTVFSTTLVFRAPGVKLVSAQFSQDKISRVEE